MSSAQSAAQPNKNVEDCACESQVLPEALAIVNGVRITRQDIERATEESVNQLQRQVIEARKRELDLQINSRLLAIEAKRRGISTTKLLEQEVVAKVKEPTEAEAQIFYDQNKSKDNRFAFVYRNCVAARVVLLAFICTVAGGWETASAQTVPSSPPTASPQPTPAPQSAANRHESERSDKLTGGRIELAEFEPNQPDIRLTLNVPTFRLTLWQNGKEVKSYFIGVGMKEHPLYIGDRQATEIIWNPAWIPPSSDWVSEIKSVRPGEVIKASDPRNPLGKMKIPLGDRYLIHQAAKTTDVGNLVSHGCVRMPRPDLYDLAEKIVAARSAPVSRKRIEAAKRNLRTLVVHLDEPVPVDINYDTLVVEEGVLHIYPDVYARGTNRPARLRAELQASNIDVANLSDATIKQMLRKVTRRTQFVVETRSLAEGRALEDGKVVPLIPTRKK